MAIEQIGGMGNPSVANPLAGKDMLAELLKLYEQGTRGQQPVQNTRRTQAGEIYNRYKPPGQMQIRFPWARPNRAS